MTALDVSAASGPLEWGFCEHRPVSRCAFLLAKEFAAGRTPGTTKAWVTPRPAATPRHPVIQGGFVVDDGRVRRLEQHARHLGFDGLRSYLQTRCDGGHSVPGLARELGESEWTVTQVLTALGVMLPPRPQRLAQQRRRYARVRIARRVAELGFAEVRAYLEDRLVEREWLLVEVAAELAVDRRTVRRLMQRVGVTRGRRTARQLAVGERGRQVQSVSWQQRRAARLVELGFADLAGYLQARHVEQGWPVKRMRAELQVGRNWLVTEMARLRLR